MSRQTEVVYLKEMHYWQGEDLTDSPDYLNLEMLKVPCNLQTHVFA